MSRRLVAPLCRGIDWRLLHDEGASFGRRSPEQRQKSWVDATTGSSFPRMIPLAGVPSRALPDTRRAAIAVFASFGQGGFVFSSWASRIPEVRDDLHLSVGSLGLVLMAVALGSTVSVPLSGVAITRLGDSRVVGAMSLLVSVGLGVVALTAQVGPIPLSAGLALMGLGTGVWDVALNVQGAAIELHLERSVLARFYAGSSVGTVLGAGAGVLMLYLNVPLPLHLGGVALLIMVTAPFVTRSFVANQPRPSSAGKVRAQPDVHSWITVRTALLGLLVFCMALSEGAGNDWIGVAMVDGYSASVQTGTVTLTAFLVAMTCVRWFGPPIIDRFGRARALSGVLSCGLIGLGMVVFGQLLPVAMCGATLWGIGTSLGMPIGLSVAAAGRESEGTVTTVASIGYLAFLGGPPGIGLLANGVGALNALLLIAAMFVLALFLVPAIAKEPGVS